MVSDTILESLNDLEERLSRIEAQNLLLMNYMSDLLNHIGLQKCGEELTAVLSSIIENHYIAKDEDYF